MFYSSKKKYTDFIEVIKMHVTIAQDTFIFESTNKHPPTISNISIFYTNRYYFSNRGQRFLYHNYPEYLMTITKYYGTETPDRDYNEMFTISTPLLVPDIYIVSDGGKNLFKKHHSIKKRKRKYQKLRSSLHLTKFKPDNNHYVPGMMYSSHVLMEQKVKVIDLHTINTGCDISLSINDTSHTMVSIRRCN